MEMIWLLCILLGIAFGSRGGCGGALLGGFLGFILGPIGVIITLLAIKGKRDIEVVVVNK